MTDEVITSLDQVTTTWLTEVLRHSGALEQGNMAYRIMRGNNSGTITGSVP